MSVTAPSALIIDGSRLITQDFTIGQITQEESVALIPRPGGVVVRSLDGEVFIPTNMVTEVAGALLSVVLR